MGKRRSTKLPTRGKRSGVTIEGGAEKDGNQMESINNFYDQARSPEEKKDDDPTAKQSTERVASRPPVRSRKGPARKAQEKIRVSLPGQAADGDDASTSTDSSANINGKQQYVNKKSEPRTIMGIPSPSEISRVSTIPPTPGTDLRNELLSPGDPTSSPLPISSGKQGSPVKEVEVARHAEARESQEQPVPADEQETDDFDVLPENDDDDGDDLAPPVMDDSMDDQEEPVRAPTMQPENEEDSKPGAKTTIPDLSDSDDDDDKEGLGFAMMQDAETSGTEQDARRPVEDEDEEEEPVRARKKKESKRRDSVESEDKTPVRGNKTKKKIKRVGFSPQGIPIANRDYQRIPVVEPSPDDAGALRRSRRAKTSPLQFWKNERVEYGPPDDDLAEEIGDMPIPRHVVKALPTPYRKRKDPPKPKMVTKNGKSKQKKRSRQVEEDDHEDDHSFDPALLKRKYKENLLEGETANVWDDGNDDLNDLKVVSYAAKMEAADLPLLSTRTKEEGNIVGSAAQAFNVPSDANDNYVGYIMGNLLLPPRGIKDAESVGPCSQTFTVCTGQKRALEVAFADPDGPEGMLDDNTAQRFLLGPGDLFRVPPGNTYRLANHSTTKPCLLTWTIIRPRNIQTQANSTTTAATPQVAAEQESP